MHIYSVMHSYVPHVPNVLCVHFHCTFKFAKGNILARRETVQRWWLHWPFCLYLLQYLCVHDDRSCHSISLSLLCCCVVGTFVRLLTRIVCGHFEIVDFIALVIWIIAFRLASSLSLSIPFHFCGCIVLGLLRSETQTISSIWLWYSFLTTLLFMRCSHNHSTQTNYRPRTICLLAIKCCNFTHIFSLFFFFVSIHFFFTRKIIYALII